METLINPSRSSWEALSERPLADDPVVKSRVETILARVKEKGDDALRELSLEIDGRPLENIEISQNELNAVRVSPEIEKAIGEAAIHITAFHAAQKPREVRVETAPGVTCIQRPVPIGKVGLYIPGGSAPLFSTVLMLALPARLAGCREIILCTPAQSPEVLYAARVCGVGRIFRVGGAHKALEKSRNVVLSNLEDRIDFANTYAPEHLIIECAEPWKLADAITAAGSVFVGPYTPESAGDYASGTNHTLPTCGWARAFSGVNMDSYYRKMTLQEITREGLAGLRNTIVNMAVAEGLDAHANAVIVRTDE